VAVLQAPALRGADHDVAVVTGHRRALVGEAEELAVCPHRAVGVLAEGRVRRDVGVHVAALERGDDVGDPVQVGAAVTAGEHEVLGEHLVGPVPVVVVDDVPVVGEQRLDGEDVLGAQHPPIIARPAPVGRCGGRRPDRRGTRCRTR
jgi:hypothetical protein